MDLFQNLARGYSNDTMEYVNLALPRLLSTFTRLQQYRVINEVQANNPVSQAVNYMVEITNKGLTLTKIAQEVNLSPSYFSRLFKKVMSISPQTYRKGRFISDGTNLKNP